MKAARLSPKRRRTAFQPSNRDRLVKRSDGFLQLLRGAERDLLARLDLDRLAGRRVAAHARGALAHLQDAEPADADARTALEVLGDCRDHLFEHGHDLLL